MTTPKPQQKYDYTGPKRVKKQREELAAQGGARIDQHVDADGLKRLEHVIKSGKATSRRAAVNYAIKQLPLPDDET